MLKIVDNSIFAVVCIRSQAEEENLHSALFFFCRNVLERSNHSHFSATFEYELLSNQNVKIAV